MYENGSEFSQVLEDVQTYPQTYPPKVQIHVFIFYNPYSGNRQGMQMKNYAEQFVRLKKYETVQVQMYDLTDCDDCNKGFAYLKTLTTASTTSPTTTSTT